MTESTTCEHKNAMSLIHIIAGLNNWDDTKAIVHGGQVTCTLCNTQWQFRFDPSTQYTTLYRMWQG